MSLVVDKLVALLATICKRTLEGKGWVGILSSYTNVAVVVPHTAELKVADRLLSVDCIDCGKSILHIANATSAM